MLELKNISKNYYVGDQTVEALKNVSLKFRKSEFVSILGPSGCGKTTMLNIIGGLDRYTDGDLLIDNKSTKSYKDKDWDAYRNQIIGFVFQNYNLISHLSVLDNIEMALSLSGVSAKERKERSIKVLEQVGLGDQVYKKPNQLSGGQMQRVAIARALVNEPKILLADEPTGALDSKTSAQIMKLIKEISKDILVIMVTHNSKIANEYSDRLIQLLDGEVLSDTNGIKEDELKITETLGNTKTSMSFYQALKTSFKNLITKKGRTFITAIAGSIGIIGVALVLGISTGMTNYVNEIQGDTLSGFPITITQYVQADFGPGGGNAPFDIEDSDTEFPTGETITPYDSLQETTLHRNVISEEYIEFLEAMDSSLYSSISYTRSMSLNIVAESDSGAYELVELDNDFSFFGGSGVFNEMPSNQEFVESQYDILKGMYPTNYNEIILVVDKENQLDVETLAALGININDEYTFDDFIGKEFKVVTNDLYYTEIMGIYLADTDYEAMYTSDDAITLTVTGILRVNEDATSEILSSGIGYTPDLTDHMLSNAMTSEIVLAQIASPDTNVLIGQPFNEQVTYDAVMQILGGDATPTGAEIYPTTYEGKDEIKAYLDTYNDGLATDETVIYTDLSELISSTISSLINTITIVLTAFAGISLVVSSIMIGIITYVSVIERTKEIGIMRSLGARKKDISRIFNAETLLIGLTSGGLGIAIYYLLQGPLNLVISKFIDVGGFATLPAYYAVGLIALSSVLTLIAGFIPSGIAARKDPVIALRTE
ncbi:ABC transporter ATP-binding protein/permease [Candidatus Izimaplasma bacterium HR1]|uniref:ABC transporter ATP-binding protein/permease n=1 Tax=Candidatus Izimoplasma sp. HR1 TaxID=1541959 RepID=UPI00056F5C4E